MSRFLLRRTFSAVLTVLGGTVVAFVVMRLLPGDPARLVAGEFASAEAVAEQHRALGLDEPLWSQYLIYMADFFRGDWGFSYSLGEPVFEQFVRSVPATVELAAAAVTLAFAGGVIGALISSYSRGGPLDAAVRASSYIGLGTAPFWLGLLLLIVFFERLQWLPGPEGRLSSSTAAPPPVTGLHTVDALLAGEWATLGDAAVHLILPAVTLGFVIYAFLVRMLRASMLELVREPYILVARSKGRGRWGVIVRDVLPNALLPAITVGGLVLAELLTSTVLAETVFGWPGVGKLVTDAILQQDFAVVQAFIMISACLTVACNIVVDLLYGIADPRVRVRSS
ncbi:ABC transporter permease [Sinosporangium siamense]|uniref:ABC transporter permease n=1 Tax=Sinosporangium siamense TaxID=1367973 RepID=A0A919RMT9_9ACTN|nr:ABC transporter permease [Sinosporangium siamense]GII95339.1 ABC transporter permease [Sinosporangium siamense]